MVDTNSNCSICVDHPTAKKWIDKIDDILLKQDPLAEPEAKKPRGGEAPNVVYFYPGQREARQLRKKGRRYIFASFGCLIIISVIPAIGEFTDVIPKAIASGINVAILPFFLGGIYNLVKSRYVIWVNR